MTGCQVLGPCSEIYNYTAHSPWQPDQIGPISDNLGVQKYLRPFLRQRENQTGRNPRDCQIQEETKTGDCLSFKLIIKANSIEGVSLGTSLEKKIRMPSAYVAQTAISRLPYWHY